MALTEKQDIPIKPISPSEPWTFRKLFPFKATVSSLVKNFNNPFDVLVVFLILVIGLGDLLNIEISWMTYLLTVLVLGTSLVQHRENHVEKKLK